MIVKTSAHKSFVALVHYLKLEVVFALLYSSFIYYLYEHHNLAFLASFSFMPVGFFGAILSVFLAFRNNNSYGRWWEARQLWGDLVNASRQFGLQVMTLIEAPYNHTTADGREPDHNEKVKAYHAEIINRHLACISLFRMQLRQDVNFAQVRHFLNQTDQERVSRSINPATQLLVSQGERIKDAANEGYLSDFQLISLVDTISRFYNILGACERIKNTPFPREYDGFIRYLIWIQISIIPIYFLGIFSDDLSKIMIIPLTIAVTLIIGFANKAGEIMEDPFENRIHDIPMSALCNTIERDMLQQLGSERVPDKLPAEDHVIW